jgi:hypothetical protein
MSNSLCERAILSTGTDQLEPHFYGAGGGHTPEGDQMRIWTEALDHTRTTPGQPSDLVSQQPQPAHLN